MNFLDPEEEKQAMEGASVMAPMPGPASAPGAGGSGTGAGGGHGGAAPAAPAAAAHPAGGGHPIGTGFINLSRYVGANQGSAQGMADAIGGDVAAQGQRAMSDASLLQGEMAHSTAPTAAQVAPALQQRLGAEATQATMGAQALQSPGGIGALLTQHFGGGGGYGSGMRGFDSFLAGQAGGTQFQQLGNQYGGLDKYVAGISAAPYAPQTITQPGAGIHGGAAGQSPAGMLKPAAPPAPAAPSPTLPLGGAQHGPGSWADRNRSGGGAAPAPAAAPTAPGGGGGPDASADRRKRRGF